MTRKRIALGGVAAVVAAVTVLLGGVFEGASPTRAGQAAVPAETVTGRVLDGFSPAADTDSLVRRLQTSLRDNPRDQKSLALLGLAYQQRARETGDPSYYAKAESALERALTVDPEDLTATSGLGSLALARHEFGKALALGERARAISPSTARSYGVIGDALIELGRYDEAFAAFDTMASLKPGLAAYSRVSYARELLGKPRQSIAAMELALDAARGAPEPYAWTSVQLGKIHWSIGEVDAARRNYREALRALPGYVYALEELARVEAARGRHASATALAKRAVETVPLPQFVTLLGDLYHVNGREALAREQYEVMDVIRRLLTANGVKTDLETALYYADHGIRLPQALELARAAQRERPSINGDDTLAWALERNGRCEEAVGYSKQALRLGTLDAIMFFHRGMIERCLGHEQSSRGWFRRALELNPHFSLLWAPVARAAIGSNDSPSGLEAGA